MRFILKMQLTFRQASNTGTVRNINMTWKRRQSEWSNQVGQLNRMVTAYLVFPENMAMRKIPLTMQDWETRLNSFIGMFDYGMLNDAGRVSAEIAKLHALTEFEEYRVIQDQLFMLDYDRFLLELEADNHDSESESNRA